MRRLVVGVGLGLLLAGGFRIAAAQGTYRPPDCDLNTGHFLVNSGVVYISSASEESDPVKRERLLGDAHRNLTEALARGQEDNPAVWYFLGRYYAMMRDVHGADSAFSRALEGAPDCAEDIDFYRQTLWVPLLNRAIDSLRAGQFEAAKDILRDANVIYDEDNLGFYYLGRIFGNEGNTDSALYYFKRAVEIGVTDTTRVDNYNTSLFNVGLLYSMMQEWDSAAVWYERYREEVDPKDPEALTGLATAYQRAGDTERAMMLYDSVISNAEEMDAFNLFKTGEALFIAERYEMAARAFELGLEKNRFYRPALYNLANAYLALSQAADEAEDTETADEAAAQMEAVARRLWEIDPASIEAIELLAAALQLQGKDDETLALLEQREEMDFEIALDLQQETQSGYLVQGRIANRTEEELTTPELVFEFLDGQGNVLATETYAGQTLAAGATESFQIVADGEDIVAVRYEVGGADE